ncbi:MAG: multicomponent Na+:H+ antiporter subunit B [Elusimicrobia bacterium]|nr:MAG: multicomponent Na+:H+ antiporter subunit B [Elusimicrobiota bacterium]KAF0157320.1 MAG: multicomponent Na+:H+ antiporter subunit B [Elusimicrobiota bacterium]
MALKFVFLFILVVCAAAAVRARDLLSSVILLCAYSLVMTLTWTQLNAVDVALTEAAVGAGIVTVLLIAALGRTVSLEEAPAPAAGGAAAALRRALPLLTVLCTGAVLVYGTLDMPGYGDPSAPANTHVAARYIAGSVPETGIVNFVTAILASYRGYDTFGETTVIFAAAVCGMLILGKGRRK